FQPRQRVAYCLFDGGQVELQGRVLPEDANLRRGHLDHQGPPNASLVVAAGRLDKFWREQGEDTLGEVQNGGGAQGGLVSLATGSPSGAGEEGAVCPSWLPAPWPSVRQWPSSQPPSSLPRHGYRRR